MKADSFLIKLKLQNHSFLKTSVTLAPSTGGVSAGTSKGLSTGIVIALSVLGVFIVIVLILIVVVFMHGRRRRIAGKRLDERSRLDSYENQVCSDVTWCCDDVT